MSNLRWNRRDSPRWKYPRYILSGENLNWGWLQFTNGKWVLEIWTQRADVVYDAWEVRAKFQSLEEAKSVGKLLCAAAMANARNGT